MATPELNRNFASAVGADGLPVYAPAYIMVGGRLKLHPTANDYAAHSPPCWPVLANPAPGDPPSGYHYEFRSYEFAEGAFRRTYALVADPPPQPRRWSRLSIKTALAQAGMLAAARAYLSAVEIATGYTGGKHSRIATTLRKDSAEQRRGTRSSTGRRPLLARPARRLTPSFRKSPRKE